VSQPYNDNEFTYGYHDGREIRGDMVRPILVVDVGLDGRPGATGGTG
jgi:hypothetical protein